MLVQKGFSVAILILEKISGMSDNNINDTINHIENNQYDLVIVVGDNSMRVCMVKKHLLKKRRVPI